MTASARPRTLRLHATALAAAVALAACSRAPEPDAPAPGPAPAARPAPPLEPATAPPADDAPGEAEQAAGPARDPGSDPEGDAEVEQTRWKVSLEAPASVRTGAPARARITVRGRDGFHVNLDYPATFRPSNPALFVDGARIPLRPRFANTPCPDDESHVCTAEATVRFVPPEPGRVRLAGTLAFSVCSDDLCLIEKVPLVLDTTAR